MDLFARETVTLEAHDVESGQDGTIAERHAVRDEIILDPRHATDKRVSADANKLMHGAKTAENRVLAHGDMSGEGRIVDHDYMVGELAVVGDMRADHQEAVGTDAGDTTAALGARIDGDVFANDSVIADFEPCIFAVIFQILRNVTDRGERKNLTGTADRRFPGQHDMRVKHAAGADLDLGTDDAERTDADVSGKTRALIDQGGRMDVGHTGRAYVSTMMALTSACLLWLMPAGQRALRDKVVDIRADMAGALLNEGEFNTSQQGLTIFIRQLSNKGEIKGILVHNNRERARPITYIAEKGILAQTPAGGLIDATSAKRAVMVVAAVAVTATGYEIFGEGGRGWNLGGSAR